MIDWLRRRYRALPAPVRGRIRRLWVSAMPILQCGLAAAVAWWLAVHLFAHSSPFFAPIAAVISLGLSLTQRWRRSVELVGGVTLGILVGDLLVSWIGTGTWQIGVVVALAMAIAVFLDNGPLIPMQAASSAVLVATLLPPGGPAGINRAVDALIGGLVGLAVGSLAPVHPALRARRDAADLLGTMRNAATTLADGVRTNDEDQVYAALEVARGTQAAINAMHADMRGGREVSTVSPLYWASRIRLQRISATADPIDNGIRNFRIVARRTLSMTQRGEVLCPELVEVLDDLPDVFEVLRKMMMAPPGRSPDQADAARVLRSVARKARRDLADDIGFSETALLAEIRSMLVDLLMVCGLRRSSALATLR